MLGEGPTDDVIGSVGTAEKNFVLFLVIELQNFTWVCIIMVIIVVLVLEKKSLSLKPIIKTSTFQLNFVQETSEKKIEKKKKTYLKNMMLSNLGKRLLEEMLMIFQSIIMLLINLLLLINLFY